LGTAETRQPDFNGKSANNNKWEKSANKIRRKNLQQSLELVFLYLVYNASFTGKNFGENSESFNFSLSILCFLYLLYVNCDMLYLFQ